MVTSDMVNVKVMKTKTAVEEIRRSMQTIQQSKLLDITNVNYLSSKMSMYFTYHIFECIAFIGLCFGQIYLIKKLFGNSSILWWILNDVKYVMYIIILFIISFLFSFWLFFLFFWVSAIPIFPLLVGNCSMEDSIFHIHAFFAVSLKIILTVVSLHLQIFFIFLLNLHMTESIQTALELIFSIFDKLESIRV